MTAGAGGRAGARWTTRARAGVVVGVWSAGLCAATLHGAPREVGFEVVADLMAAAPAVRARAAERLVAAADRRWIAPVVDALFFISPKNRVAALAALAALAGEERGARYLDWVEWVGEHPESGVPPDYLNWKANLLARIDIRYKGILHPAVSSRVSLAEVVWGGVRVEGIPTLDRPAAVAANEASFLADSERVFGVVAGGEARAYPQRVLSWHELVNDQVGGESLTLSYCTLCGSAVLYAGRDSTGVERRFGTSGLLWRGNKLMIDRATMSLWSNLTGEAVIGGGLAESRLIQLPITVTTWGEWRRRNPRTTAMKIDAELGRRHGYDYRAGAAETARAGVRFPHGPQSARLPAATEILAVRSGALAKAYALDDLAKAGVVNDLLGGEPLLVVVEEASGAARVFRRGPHTFESHPGENQAGGSHTGMLRDERGRAWQIEETALDCAEEACAGERLERWPSHLAFWAGWFGFHPQTEVFAPPESPLPVLRSPPPPGGGS